MRTVPVGIALLPSNYQLPWGDVSAASVVATVPLIALVLIFQKKIIAGLTAGGIKG
jgi:multiple sugar transport system permease protein